MYERSNVDLENCHSSQTIYPPWRQTEIPVELFDLMTAPPSTCVRLFRLHYEILKFYHFMIPTPEERAVRQQVIYRIREIILQYLPSAAVDVYGSHETQLNLPTSDVDLIIYSADGRQWDADELVKIMSDLRDAFCQNEICTEEEVKVLNRATVPIIKLTDRQTDVKVDMSFNMNGGPRSTQLIMQYIEDYPYLKYLFYVLKQYLYQLDLNKVWTGGISSYSLILMIVCFFQVYYKKDQNAFSSSQRKSFVSPPLKVTGTIDEFSSSVSCPSSSAASCISSDDQNNCSNPSSDNDDEHSNRIYCPTNVPMDHVNLGHMLLSFLHLYGIEFDYAKFGIRVQRPNQSESTAGFIAKEELFKNFSCGHRTTTNLCIVDPFDDANDIGKASWLIPRLQEAFKDAYKKLCQSLASPKTPSTNSPSILAKIINVDARILAYREQLHLIYNEYSQQLLNKQIRYDPSIYCPPGKAFIDCTNGMPLIYPSFIPYPTTYSNPMPPLRTNFLK